MVRREVERCDSLQGFQVTHSLGFGMGSLVMSRIREEYTDSIMNTFSIAPSRKASSAIVDMYNTVLTIQQLLRSSDGTFCFENDAVYDICRQKNNFSATFDDLNDFISTTMGGVTASLRFPTSCPSINTNLRKLSQNMVQYPRLHFFTTRETNVASAE